MTAAERRRGPGRPPMANGVAKLATFSVRLTPEERAALDAAATAVDLSSSEWARRVLVAAAKSTGATQPDARSGR